MKKIAKVFPFRLNSFTHEFVKCKNFGLIIILSFSLLESLQSQSFFSPNAKVVIDQKKSDTFIKATPEIALKADYYNISIPVLETVLLVQSNSGTIISDGKYNYKIVKVYPELTTYLLAVLNINYFFHSNCDVNPLLWEIKII